MTPKRKEYLDGISREEQTIRQYIANLKTTIAVLKALCKEDKFAYVLQKDKQEISKFKTIIKALKKQLPQKLVYVSANEDNIHWCLNCPACHYTIVPSNFTMSFFRNYCPCCGQKLR